LVFFLRFGAPETGPGSYTLDALPDGCPYCGFILLVFGFGGEFVSFYYFAVFVFYNDLLNLSAAVQNL
jgi:hypothetical protein